MGLDFMVYIAEKGAISPTDEDQAWDYTNKLKEVAYGRKSWEVVHALNIDVNKTYSTIAKEDWDNLIKGIRSSEWLIRKTYELSDEVDKTHGKDADLCDDLEKFLYVYYQWHDDFFDEEPMLGYDFSLSYMISMLDADAAVQQAYKDGKEVWGFASY